jgi:uncharacterized protein (TIGR02145 family)
VDLGSGLGTFSTAVTGLAEGTTYYFVAYAINSEGTAYGSTLNFTTGQINPPGVSTNVAGSITETSAVVGGEVSDGGGGSVSDRGIYYGTSSDPGSSGTKLSRGSGLGSFTATLTGLTPGTRYYYVAYATNEAGTSLGSTLYFETVASSTSVTDIDGNVYQIVTIGDQTWMQENLRTTRYADGSTIPNVTGASTWGGLSSSAKAYCYYDNNSANANDYGALYTWAAAMNGASSTTASPSGIQGVCPSGWHMPSDEEWKELEMYLGMSRSDADNTSFRGTTEGGKLKETGYSRWQSPNTGATNSSGFTAPGSGYRLDDGDFGYIHYVATFWTASQSSSSDAYNRTLHYDGSQVYRNGFAKHRGFSVRCVKNE